MLWSILICGIPERYHLVQPLLYSLLEVQGVSRNPDVEVLYLMDNRRRSVGAKRNVLLDAAMGEYISFIDDDDAVSGEYVAKILAIIKQHRGTDVICFPQRATLAPHGIIHECTYSLTHKSRDLKPTDKPNVLDWTGPPAHTMVWRRELIKDVTFLFPDKQFGEDVNWVDRMCEHAKSEVQMGGPPLYFYNFDPERSATRG